MEPKEPKIENPRKDVATRIREEWSMSLDDYMKASADSIAQHFRQMKEWEANNGGARHPESEKVLKEIDDLKKVLEDLGAEIE